MAGTSYISGIISGLDTDEIITELTAAAQAPIDRLNEKSTTYENQLSAWQDCNTRLLALQTQAQTLNDPAIFNACTVTSSASAIVTATAGESAVAGIYTLSVEQVATAHQLASQGFADYDTTTVGSGTFSITVGDGSAVDIDVENLTLAQLRDAINQADAGVNAYIINDGSSSPYRLVLTSETTGAAGALTVTTDLTGGTAPTLTETQAAQDALLKLGQGTSAITITSSGNTVTDVIPGVTLELQQANAGQTVTLTVARDTTAISDAVNGLVEQYNALIDFISEETAYDSTTEETGTLFGEYALQQVRNQLRSIISADVAGTSSYCLLSQIGVTANFDGQLEVNATKLAQALANDPEGVAALFTQNGSSTDSQVAFVGATSDTKSSGAAGYEVVVTQAATRSRVTAGVAQTSALVADETLTLNGVEIQLTAGMTQQDVLDAINAHGQETGISASATAADGTGAGNYLTLQRITYGARTISAVSSASGGDATSGLGNVEVTATAPEGESGSGSGVAGVDVAGTIGGQAARGYGQTLTGTAGDAKGLSVTVNATTAGTYGSVVFSQGIAGNLNQRLTYLLEADDSPIATACETTQDKIDDIGDQVSHLEELLDKQTTRIREQFDTLESKLSELESLSSYLTSAFENASSSWSWNS